jgi:hypothetical protein
MINIIYTEATALPCTFFSVLTEFSESWRHRSSSQASSTSGMGEVAQARVWATLGWWRCQFLIMEELWWQAQAAVGSGPWRLGKPSIMTAGKRAIEDQLDARQLIGWSRCQFLVMEEQWCRACEGKRLLERSSSNTSCSFPMIVARGGQSSRRGRAPARAEEGKVVLLCAHRQWPGKGPGMRMWRMTHLCRWFQYF